MKLSARSAALLTDTVARNASPLLRVAARTMEIRALSGEALGVEVLNADLRTATADDIERMVDAMHRTGRGVVVVRDQHLRPLDCERACALLAPHFVAQQPYTRWPGQSKPIPGCPHLALLGNYRARENGEFGMDVVKGEVIGEYKPAANTLEEWHTDGSFLPMPKVAIALYAPQLEHALPPTGGETRFASCTAAFESLDPETQGKMRSLASVHSWEKFMRLLESRDAARPKVTTTQIAAKPPQTWPIVRTHPVTKAESLYINPKNTAQVVDVNTGESIPEDDAKILIDELAAAVVGDGLPGNQKVYAHRWKRGDFVIWDNRVLLHAASPFDAERYERLLFRMEFKGEKVLGPTTP